MSGMSITPGISRMSLTQRPDASDVPLAALVTMTVGSQNPSTVEKLKSVVGDDVVNRPIS